MPLSEQRMLHSAPLRTWDGHAQLCSPCSCGQDRCHCGTACCLREQVRERTSDKAWNLRTRSTYGACCHSTRMRTFQGLKKPFGRIFVVLHPREFARASKTTDSDRAACTVHVYFLTIPRLEVQDRGCRSVVSLLHCQDTAVPPGQTGLYMGNITPHSSSAETMRTTKQ